MLAFEDGSYSAMDDGGARVAKMDSSKEFEEVLRGSINGLTYFHSEADIPGVEEYNPSQAEQHILAAHHKATQARVRESLTAVQEKLIDNIYNHGGNTGDDIIKVIDAEFNRVEGDSNGD